MPRTRVRFTILAAMATVTLLAVVWWALAVLKERRAMAERERCRIAIEQLAMALRGFAFTRGAFPVGTMPSRTLPPERRISWVPAILPWTDHYQNIRYLFESDRPWDSAENRLPRIEVYSPDEPARVFPTTQPPEFPRGLMCPANHCAIAPGLPRPLHYAGIAGVGQDSPGLPSGHLRAGVFGYDRQTRTSDITDGASTTMMLAETTMANGPWTAGGPSTVRGLDPARRPYLGPGHQFGGSHRGGAMAAFADGSVRYLRDTIAFEVFEALSTVAGGEILADGWER